MTAVSIRGAHNSAERATNFDRPQHPAELGRIGGTRGRPPSQDRNNSPGSET